MTDTLLSQRDLGSMVQNTLASLYQLRLPVQQAIAFLQTELPWTQISSRPRSPSGLDTPFSSSISIRYVYRRRLKSGHWQAHTVDVTYLHRGD